MNRLKRKVREWQYRREASHVLAGRLAAADHRIAMLEVEVADQTDRACGAEIDALHAEHETSKWKARYTTHVQAVNLATSAAITTAIREARKEERSIALLATMRAGEQTG